MPRGDKTGPTGEGTMTGRGLGTCNESTSARGAGFGGGARRGSMQGAGRGIGRGMGFNQQSSQTSKELLTSQKEMLQDRINLINEQLEEE